MFRIPPLAAAGALAVAAAAPVQAQTFSPTNSTSTLWGFISVDNGVTSVDCEITMTVDIDMYGYARIGSVSFDPGQPFYCGFIVRPVRPYQWAIMPGAMPGTLGFYIQLESVTDFCAGYVEADYYIGPGHTSFSWTQLNTAGGAPCYVDGDFYADPIFSF